MAESYKILAQSSPLATTSTDVYTVPAATSTVISTVTICNRGTSTIKFRMSVAIAGAVLANTQYTHYDVSVPANDTLALVMGITLAATDVIRIYTDLATISVNVFGGEIT